MTTKKNRVTAALMSYWAYPWGPDDEVLGAYLGSTPTVHKLQYDSLEGFHVVLPEVQYIVLRGTEPRVLKDWLWDARFWPKPLGKGLRAHTGFWEGARHLLKQVTLVQGLPVVVTGHSLGGGLGSCIAAMLLRRGFKVELITFGCPRVGGRGFGGLVGPVHTRYVHDCDVVTRVPPALPSRKWRTRLGRLFAGRWFVHNGTAIHFDQMCLMNPGITPIKSLFGSREDQDLFLSRIRRLVEGVKDHSMSDYLRFVIWSEIAMPHYSAGTWRIFAKKAPENIQPLIEFLERREPCAV